MSTNRINLSSWVLIAVAVLSFCLLLEAGVVGSNAHPVDEDNKNTNILTNHDMDEDGLSDSLEEDLGTEKNNKYGDFDNDGLYDFEEYLDMYGTGGATPKYKYNDSTTYDGANGPILDIYHYFNLSTNKSMYHRDTKYSSTKSGGFTDTLFWNIDFDKEFAGGSNSEDGIYRNNIFENVNFSANSAGGSYNYDVTYENNTLRNVIFSKEAAGGSIEENVIYRNNVLENVIFSGVSSGGSSGRRLEYMNNVLVNVTFSGSGSGASGSDLEGSRENHPVIYTNNSFKQVVFSGQNAGIRWKSGSSTTYTNNTFNDVKYSNIMNFFGLGISSTGNKIVSDIYDSDDDRTPDVQELFVHITNPTESDTDSDTLGDSWEIRYKEISGVNPRSAASQTELDSDGDDDGLTLTEEAAADTNPDNNDTDGDGLNDSYEVKLKTDATLADTDGDGLNDSYEVELKTNATLADTDGDGLGDAWEVKYNGSSDVNPLDKAMNDKLVLDTDDDGLNLSREATAFTNPDNPDTDGDGLGDGWEVMYIDVQGIDPVIPATPEDLKSDTDDDDLTLLEEFQIGTNPWNADSDGDGLGDGWELRYNESLGVNPLINASSTELSSDTDGDGLTLLQEAQGNTDPSKDDSVLDDDKDGLTNKLEVQIGSDPFSNDTDDDGIPDEYEYLNGLSLNKDDAAGDLDKDGLNNLLEFQLGSTGNNSDTDSDGIPDGYEYANGLSLNKDDAAGDLDEDGLNNSYEFSLGLLANNSDSDNDTLPDGYEVNNGLDPELDDSSSDKDGDDWTNLEEFRAGTDPSDSLDYPADDFGQEFFRWINVNVYDTGLSRVSILISIIAIVAVALLFLILLFIIIVILKKIFR